MPRYLETFYPHSTSTVIEIDPMVTEINHRELGLSRETRIRSINHDARQAIHRWSEEEKMDLVFGDAFNDFSIPFHLTTIEFHQELKARMAQDGVYALNIIDDAKYGNFLAAMTKTLRSIWKHVYLISGSRDIAPRRNTFILMASDEPLDLTRWLQVETFAAAEFDGKVLNRAEMLSFIPEEDLQTFLDERTVEVLRDELVPTDRYLAPVFSDDH
jgi:spermidine synthase